MGDTRKMTSTKTRIDNNQVVFIGNTLYAVGDLLISILKILSVGYGKDFKENNTIVEDGDDRDKDVPNFDGSMFVDHF